MTEPLPSDDAHRIPPQTTPVWQTELLLSGGMVFALLQLPQLIDASALWWRPRMDNSLLQVVVYAQLYARLVVASLGFAFVLHLAIRGWWIAEVGLQSIYPTGLHLDRSGGGPNTQQLRKELFRSPAERIEAADNLATMVFVSGTALAAMSIAVGFVTMTMALLATLLAWTLGTPEKSMVFLASGFTILVVPSILATLIDQLAGHWIGTEGRAGQWLRKTIRIGEVLMMSRIWSPMMLTLVGSARAAWRGWLVGGLVYCSLLTVISLQIGGGLTRHRLFMGNTPFPHASSSLLLDSRHYADQRRGSDRYSTLPHLPSRIVESDWLALTIPMDSRRDHVLLAERCPTLADTSDATAETGAAQAQAIEAAQLRLRDCLDQLRPVSLNGARIPANRAQFHRDPKGDLPSLLYMIPIADLPPDRHLLTVGRTPAVDTDRSPGSDAIPPAGSAETAGPEPYTIAFWRQPND